ncbi:MAG: glycosyltransferase family A protein, partial [Bryobacteraceae bacterium]
MRPGTRPPSLVIPVRNGAATLEQCLAAVASSTTRVEELIVVDDGSTDASAEIASRFGATVIRTAPRGPAHARNCGARAASGGLLLFCDADVCVHPDAVERVSSAFARDPGLGAMFGAYDDAPT